MELRGKKGGGYFFESAAIIQRYCERSASRAESKKPGRRRTTRRRLGAGVDVTDRNRGGGEGQKTGLRTSESRVWPGMRWVQRGIL